MMSNARTTGVDQTTIDLDGTPMRVWSKGEGPPLGMFAGWGGMPRWLPMLDLLAQHHRVVVPSLPGYPGGGRAHLSLDTHLDWIVAAHRLFSAAGLNGAALIGSSVGGALAAEMAALWPSEVRSLILIAPFGVFSPAEPPADVFAQRADEYAGLLCEKSDRYRAFRSVPEGEDAGEWEIVQARAHEAAARMLWPLGDTHLARRLPLIDCPTLVLRGEHDRIMPARHVERIAGMIGGNARYASVPDAGHLAEIDAPEAVAKAILALTTSSNS